MRFYLLRESRSHLHISVANNTRPLYGYFSTNYELQARLPATPPPPELLNFVLCLDSVVTDAVHGDSTFPALFISGRIKRLLQDFRLPPHAYYKGSLTQQVHRYEAGDLTTHNQVLDDYQLLHLPKLSTDRPLIDFEKSEFYTDWDGFERCRGPVKFRSFSKRFQFRARIDLYDSVYKGLIKPNGHSNAKLYLTEDAYQYDLIPPINFGQEYYISERLQQTLAEHQITGIQFTKAPWIQQA